MTQKYVKESEPRALKSNDFSSTEMVFWISWLIAYRERANVFPAVGGAGFGGSWLKPAPEIVRAAPSLALVSVYPAICGR